MRNRKMENSYLNKNKIEPFDSSVGRKELKAIKREPSKYLF